MQRCDIYFAVQFIGWFIIIVGWCVSNHYSSKRETRKEIRSNIDNIIAGIESLLNSSHNYYCSANANEQTVSCCEIYASFENISGYCQRLENHSSDIRLQSKLDTLYEEITGGDFGSTNLVRNSSAYIEKSKKIALLAEKIRTEAENWFTYIADKK